MAHLRFLPSPASLAAMAAAVLMLPSLAQAGLTTHTTEAAWQSAVSSPTLIDFDGLADGTVLSTQYAGLSFSAFHSGNPLAAAYVGSYSGANVLSMGSPPLTGGGGGVAIDFAAPLSGVAFWYLDSEFAGNLVTVYGAANTVLGIYELAYPRPFEWLFVGFVSSTNDITRIAVSIDGADAVSLDNLLVTSAVPEPSAAAMLLLGGLFVLRGPRRRAALPTPDPRGAAHDCVAAARSGSQSLASLGVAP